MPVKPPVIGPPAQTLAARAQLEALMARTLPWAGDASIEAYTERIRERFGAAVEAIVFYGSYLSPATRSPDSFPDFFVIAADGAPVFRGWRERLAALGLPPNVYYADLARAGEAPMPCKLNVVAWRAFQREFEAPLHDLYVVGRMTKRVGIAYARTPAVQAALIATLAAGAGALAPHVVNLLPAAFGREEWARMFVKISYLGETRVEKTDKAAALYAAAKDYYDAAFGLVLAEAVASGVCATADGLHFENRQNREVRAAGQRETARLLRRSRWRGHARWPKYLLTMDDWLEYILAKVERTRGIRVPMTPLQRRYPLLLGWGHLFRLWRGGHIR